MILIYYIPNVFNLLNQDHRHIVPYSHSNFFYSEDMSKLLEFELL